jgi:pilus assembly protein TadC
MSEGEYNIFLYILITIRNITSIICFTILAVVFRQWWIVFFSILFFAYAGKEKEDE